MRIDRARRRSSVASLETLEAILPSVVRRSIGRLGFGTFTWASVVLVALASPWLTTPACAVSRPSGGTTATHVKSAQARLAPSTPSSQGPQLLRPDSIGVDAGAREDPGPLVSGGDFASTYPSGRGRHVTIWSNVDHVFVEIDGRDWVPRIRTWRTVRASVFNRRQGLWLVIRRECEICALTMVRVFRSRLGAREQRSDDRRYIEYLGMASIVWPDSI